MLNSLFNSGGCYNLSFIVRGAQIDSPFFSPLTAIIRLPLSRQKHCAAIFFSLSLSSIPRGVVVRLRRPSICFLSVCPSSRTFFRIILRHSWFIFDHFTSFVMYFRPFLHHIFLVALPPLSIYNFTSNNHSFFSHLFQVWLYQLCKRDYSSYLDVLGLTITFVLLSHFNQSLIASRKVIDSVRR